MTAKTGKRPLHFFATVLTYAAPSSNYRGESEENRTVLQKITKSGAEFPIISPESMRNALREIIEKQGLPCNRRRLHDEGQLAVEFRAFPDARTYADDFLFGFMVADKDAIEANEGRPAKRDSFLRMNLAVAIEPYRFDAILHQSPLNGGASPWKNASTSALIHREVAYTAFQYPFALPFSECDGTANRSWALALVKAIGELSEVAGGHARSFYEMAPRSIVARLTPSLVAGFDTYGFNQAGGFPELSRIGDHDLPGAEFWIGGEIVRSMDKKLSEELEKAGVHLHKNPQTLLEEVGKEAFKGA